MHIAHSRLNMFSVAEQREFKGWCSSTKVGRWRWQLCHSPPPPLSYLSRPRLSFPLSAQCIQVLNLHLSPASFHPPIRSGLLWTNLTAKASATNLSGQCSRLKILCYIFPLRLASTQLSAGKAAYPNCRH